jgi:hypothetical protein
MRSSGLEIFSRANKITELPDLTRASAVNRRAGSGVAMIARGPPTSGRNDRQSTLATLSYSAGTPIAGNTTFFNVLFTGTGSFVKS